MTRFIRRFKPVLLALGIALFGLAVLIGILAAGIALGSGPEQTDWKRIILLHTALFAVFTAAALAIGNYAARRTVRKLEDALNHMQHSSIRGLHDKEAAASSERNVSIGPIQEVGLLLNNYADMHAGIVESLKRSNSFWVSLIEHSTDAIYVMDLDGRIYRTNPAFEALYGYNADELTGTRQPFVPEHLHKEYQELIRQVKNGGEVSGYETVRRNKSGSEVHISLTLSPVLLDDGQLVALASISRNITERKETEELLRRSEKLSVIGQLAAGVAHEIRNPLTTLRGFVQLLKHRQAGNAEHMDLMLEELDRINFIVSEFIILSKPHLNQFLFKDPTELLTDLIRILEPQSNMSGVRLEMRFASDIPRIRCEENQLKQVFLNVIKNGMEAMPEGGVVKVEAANLESGRILIRFTDHGAGIPEDMLTRLGEPFLTNKANGTGLGIMVSQQIVANHKGRMIIRSELGKGTCVDIVLPVDFEHMLGETEAAIKMGMPQ
jgi:PAS domain S-box-containing protein